MSDVRRFPHEYQDDRDGIENSAKPEFGCRGSVSAAAATMAEVQAHLRGVGGRAARENHKKVAANYEANIEHLTATNEKLQRKIVELQYDIAQVRDDHAQVLAAKDAEIERLKQANKNITGRVLSAITKKADVMFDYLKVCIERDCLRDELAAALAATTPAEPARRPPSFTSAVMDRRAIVGMLEQ